MSTLFILLQLFQVTQNTILLDLRKSLVTSAGMHLENMLKGG